MYVSKQILFALSLQLCATQLLIAHDPASITTANEQEQRLLVAVTNRSMELQGEPLTMINHSRVAAAQKSIAREATWATPLRYTLAGAACAFALYSFYQWYNQAPAKPELLTNENLTFLKHLTETDPQDLKKVQELLATQATVFKNSLQEALQPKQLDWNDWLIEKTKEQLSRIASLMALTVTGSIATNSVSTISSALPAHGTLGWYISARTEFRRTMGDALRYITITLHQSFALEMVIESTRFMVLDIEKIVGYLAHYEQLLAEQKAPARTIASCASYRTTIEQLTNRLVTTINTGAALPAIHAQLNLIDAEVRSAEKFVGANYK